MGIRQKCSGDRWQNWLTVHCAVLLQPRWLPNSPPLFAAAAAVTKSLSLCFALHSSLWVFQLPFFTDRPATNFSSESRGSSGSSIFKLNSKRVHKETNERVYSVKGSKKSVQSAKYAAAAAAAQTKPISIPIISDRKSNWEGRHRRAPKHRSRFLKAKHRQTGREWKNEDMYKRKRKSEKMTMMMMNPKEWDITSLRMPNRVSSDSRQWTWAFSNCRSSLLVGIRPTEEDILMR